MLSSSPVLNVLYSHQANSSSSLPVTCEQCDGGYSKKFDVGNQAHLSNGNPECDSANSKPKKPSETISAQPTPSQNLQPKRHQQTKPTRVLKPDVVRRVLYDTLMSSKLSIR